jgi:hypothetical protein
MGLRVFRTRSRIAEQLALNSEKAISFKSPLPFCDLHDDHRLLVDSREEKREGHDFSRALPGFYPSGFRLRLPA